MTFLGCENAEKMQSDAVMDQSVALAQDLGMVFGDMPDKSGSEEKDINK